MSSDWRFNDNLRVPRDEPRPILHADGRPREGAASPSQLFSRFIAGVSQRLSSSLAMVQNPSPNFAQFTMDLTLFAPPAPAPAPVPAEGEGQ